MRFDHGIFEHDSFDYEEIATDASIRANFTSIARGIC